MIMVRLMYKVHILTSYLFLFVLSVIWSDFLVAIFILPESFWFYMNISGDIILIGDSNE